MTEKIVDWDVKPQRKQTSILPGAVCWGAVYTCNHTRFIDRFMMTEGGDPLSLPFTSKTG